MVSEKEQRELDRIAYVFEKFLYAKDFKKDGYKAEDLQLTWLDDEVRNRPRGIR